MELLDRRLLMAASPYTWRNAAIGGGGYVDGVFFSPTQQNVEYVRTDIGGLFKTTDNGSHWKELLDFVGSSTTTSGNGTQWQNMGVLSFAMDPQNANNIYVMTGLYTGTNGAVFYSTDAGATWGITSLPFYVGGNSDGRGDGERLAVDPNNSNILYMGTNANGMWKSTDAGHSFAQVSGVSSTASITFVYFNSGSSVVGGATQQIFYGLNSQAGVSPQVAGAPPTNLYRTTDGGTSWAQIAGSATAGASPGRNILPVTLTTLSRSGTTATAHTAAASGLVAGDIVTIAGATPTAYNGSVTVNSTANTTTFTYTVATGADTATGTISVTDNYSWIPGHAVLASDGNLYVTYSMSLAPANQQTQGGVFRSNINTGVWANISPQLPGAGTNPQFGYLGLALDPNSPTTVVVTSNDRYSATDVLWRTTNANVATPTWVALMDTSSAQNFGYGGYNTTRDTSAAPWVAPFGDGIGNWAASVAIDPFNSAHLIYGTGQGLWATDHANSATKLTAANSWYFPDTGIEFTAVLDLAAPGTGVPLLSVMGDITGFAHTTLIASPPAGGLHAGGGTAYSLDFAQNNPNYVAYLGVTSGSVDGAYSTNNGLTWTPFATVAGTDGGRIAVSYNTSTSTAMLVWAPATSTPYYSTNNGTTWTASTMPVGTRTGGVIVSDRVTSGTFYYSVQNSGNTQISTYRSTDGGVTFTLQGAVNSGNLRLTPSPYVAGTLWMGTYNDLLVSTNGGGSFTTINGVVSPTQIALGAPAPGRTNAAVYIWGQIGSVVGAFRSDDSGATWTRINDTANQWGSLVETMAADPNVFGRVYLGINGRGVIYGTPLSSLPAGWSDADVNSPGNPGYATNTTTLSNGTIVSQWTMAGGGAGIGSGTSGGTDQFNFAYESVTGNYSAIAQIKAVNNAGTGTPQAGVMFRSGISANDPFAALVQTSAGTLIFEYRLTAGGAVTSQTLGGIPLGAEYVNLKRSGNTFTAYYGTTGNSWTQMGTPVSLSAMPASAYAGLAVSAAYNPQLSQATFANVVITSPPTVTIAAASSNNPVTNKTTTLSVTAIDDGLSSALVYTWIATTLPAGAAQPTYFINGTNSARSTLATFYKAGNYVMQVTIADASGLAVTSSVGVTVNQTLASITLSPLNTTIAAGATQQYTATAIDQFANAFVTPPAFAWARTAGTGTLDSNGLYTATGGAGNATVQVTSGSISTSTGITVSNSAPTISVPAGSTPATITGTQTLLSVLGADSDGGGEAALTYTWATTGIPPAAVVFSDNGTNTAKSTTATFGKAGFYSFQVTVTDAGGLTVTSNVAVTVTQTLTGLTITPANIVLHAGDTQTYAAVATDQFNTPMIVPIIWSCSSAAGSITSGGVFTAGTIYGTGYSITATSGAVSASAQVGVYPPVPQLTSMIINDGAIQRSMIWSLTVAFSSPVTLGSNALVLTRIEGGFTATVSITPVNGSTSLYQIGWTGTGIIGGSLPNGTYQLAVNTGAITDAYGQLLAKPAQTLTVVRLFGDSNGDGHVDRIDQKAFDAAYGSTIGSTTYRAYFDYNGDGSIDNTDRAFFRPANAVALRAILLSDDLNA